MSKQPKERFTGYSDNGIPALRIAPSSISERRKRYLRLHLITIAAICVGIMIFFFSEDNSENGNFWLCFAPGIFLFFFLTWLGYWRFGKANSRITKIICDKKKTKIIHGKKEKTYSSDKLRFEIHRGGEMLDHEDMKLFLRRPPKRKKILLRFVAVRLQDIKIVKNFCSKNELHYKEFVSID